MTFDPAKVIQRKLGRDKADAVLELADIDQMGEHERAAFWERLRDLATAALPQPVVTQLPVKPEPTNDMERAQELADEIDELAELVPDAGREFAESVQAKARDIMAVVYAFERVTGGQMDALRNMLDGLYKWTRSER